MEDNEQESETLRKELGDERYEKLLEKVSNINTKFKERKKRWKEKVTQPATPTKQQLEDLEIEVEENLKTKILIQDDFTEKNPHEGLKLLQKLKQKLLPDAIHPQSTRMTVKI